MDVPSGCSSLIPNQPAVGKEVESVVGPTVLAVGGVVVVTRVGS